ARVSTDQEEQENSLDNQIKHYENLIRNNPAYDLAGIYHDFGISGFKEKRPGFQRMMEDARNGKMDMIITKSITRFARNTDTVLKATRELKEHGIGVLFELQGIETTTSEGELLLTIYAAFGQAESESARIGAKMVFQKRCQKGDPRQGLERSFGYTKDEKGNYVLDENAKWVVRIYEFAAAGYTGAEIAKYLNEKGVRTKQGKKFLGFNVIRMIRSVVYKGDFIMQQYFTDEYRRQVLNRGELPSYYIENDHKRIVTDRLWQKAQKMLDQRTDYLSKGSVVKELTEENYPYMNKLFCAECGYKLTRRIYSEGNRMSWVCSGKKAYNESFCHGLSIPDCVVRSFVIIDEKIYISQKKDELGKTTYSYVRESTWKRKHRKKKNPVKAPELTKENYPYLGKVFCKKCGSRLSRRVNGSGEVRWACLGRLKKGTDYCEGVVIPDSVLREIGEYENNIYIGKELINGKEHYGYTSKPDRPGR
ncbi:MAG: recombinase family protein, partial [Eubacteriaceae bacterium]|nr:recombinase family protein [Eubacteriaceae bacterium]